MRFILSKTMLTYLIFSTLAVGSTALAQVEPELSPVTWDCLEQTCRAFDVPLALIIGLMDMESGQVGRVSRNKNGSYDIGPMQINSSWLGKLGAAGIDENHLRNNGCVNVAAAGWLLRSLLASEPSVQEAIARYHSPNKDRGQKYLQKVKARMYTLDVSRTLKRANGSIPGFSE